MALRFRKSIKLMPGVRVNLGKRGASLSVGPRGSTFNIGKRGIRHTASLPGTGLSYQSQIYTPGKKPDTPPQTTVAEKKPVAPGPKKLESRPSALAAALTLGVGGFLLSILYSALP